MISTEVLSRVSQSVTQVCLKRREELLGIGLNYEIESWYLVSCIFVSQHKPDKSGIRWETTRQKRPK